MKKCKGNVNASDLQSILDFAAGSLAKLLGTNLFELFLTSLKLCSWVYL